MFPQQHMYQLWFRREPIIFPQMHRYPFSFRRETIMFNDLLYFRRKLITNTYIELISDYLIILKVYKLNRTDKNMSLL